MGGQEIRIWTSFAPASLKYLTLLAAVFPLTIESSTAITRFPLTTSGSTASFISTQWLRLSSSGIIKVLPT